MTETGLPYVVVKAKEEALAVLSTAAVQRAIQEVLRFNEQQERFLYKQAADIAALAKKASDDLTTAAVRRAIDDAVRVFGVPAPRAGTPRSPISPPTEQAKPAPPRTAPTAAALQRGGELKQRRGRTSGTYKRFESIEDFKGKFAVAVASLSQSGRMPRMKEVSRLLGFKLDNLKEFRRWIQRTGYSDFRAMLEATMKRGH